MAGPTFSNNLKGGVNLSLTFEPSIGISARRVDKLGADIRSFKEVLHKSVKEVMVPSIRKNFQAGGRPTWPPLADSTLAIKAKRGFSSAPLIATGNLQRVASQINIWTITQDTAIVKDLGGASYGGVHQAGYGGSGGGGPKLSVADLRSGKKRPRKNVRDRVIKGGKQARRSPAIPQRRFLTIHPEDQRAIEQIFVEWVDERVRRNML